MKRVLAVFISAAMFLSVLALPCLHASALTAKSANPGNPSSKYAQLSGIHITAGALNRKFSPARLSYSLKLDEQTGDTTLTPVKSDAEAAVLINGQAAESINVHLENGQQKCITIKVSLQGKKSRTYTLKITRAKSTDNSLQSLTVLAGTLDVDFAPGKLKYNLALDWYSPYVTICAQKTNAYAVLSIEGRRTGAYTCKINPGTKRPIKIAVRSQAGKTKTYQLTITREASPYQGKAAALIEFAKHSLGKPYVRGAKGPDSFDCSGFVYYCLNGAGTDIKYMTSATWAKADYTAIATVKDMIPGDILCFNGHVGIYLGENTMIDAVPSAGGVRIASCVTNYWQEAFICGKRVLTEP